jgi:hypothetical protein
MEWNLTTILVLIGTLLTGYGLGLLEAHLRNSSQIKDARQKIAELEAGNAGEKSSPASAPSALQVWMNPDQTLAIELDGEHLDSPDKGNPGQRRRLITLIARLRPWVEGGPIAPGPKEEKQLNKTSSSIPLLQPKLVEPGSEPEQPSITAGKSIVQQIDTVLQDLLEGTPLAAKRIMLLESPTGGILVKVGNDQYESIDAVPEAGIQALIRQAVAKWEKG